jgi:hypothetical protein
MYKRRDRVRHPEMPGVRGSNRSLYRDSSDSDTRRMVDAVGGLLCRPQPQQESFLDDEGKSLGAVVPRLPTR